MNKGKRYYLKDKEIDLCVRALSSLGMAYLHLPSVYPNTSWLNSFRDREIPACKATILKLQAKQEKNEREYAPLLKEGTE